MTDNPTHAELVERLREAGYTIGTLEAELQVLRADAANPDKGMWTFWNDKARQLATDKAALEAENARLREALTPIAEVADRFDGDIAWSDDYAPLYPLSLRNFRRARSALNPERSEK